MTMFVAAALAVLVSLGLALVRVIKGPTIFDRLIAGNSVGTLSVLLLAVIGYVFGRPAFIDLAITYALLNVIGTIAVLKFFRYGDLGAGEDEAGP
ncbi:MAG: monovalent cation/H+ antiporter complex subunit F [Rhodospirillaceae bacterium]|nr:monovalent cation/H+ antiporter complex subunit F [Rhodospirillaceae bacterium]